MSARTMPALDSGPGPVPAPNYASREDWLATGRAILDGQSSASWSFADWLIAGEGAFGGDTLRDVADRLGISPGKISDYRLVARTYPVFRRLNGLGFSHHLEAARLPETERDNLLVAAAEGGWSVARTRAAAREISLEGKVKRQAAEIAELRRALAAVKSDPRDVAEQARLRLAASRRLIRDEAGRAAVIVEEVAADEMLVGLHGNARRGLARGMRREVDRMAAEVNLVIDRVAAAADAIEGAA